MARVDLSPKLSDEERQKQTENFYDLDRSSYLSLDQYLGSAQALRDAERLTHILNFIWVCI